MTINDKPIEVRGQNIPAGTVVMDAKVPTFKADCSSTDFERGIQNKGVLQKDLKRWCIIYTERSQRELNQFQSTIKQCLDQFKFLAAKPANFKIQGRDDEWSSWERCIQKNIRPGIDFVIFILPGAKGNGKCYHEIKRQFIQKTPVPNQVILQSTISRGKNLRQIVAKVLIQMNAKLVHRRFTLLIQPNHGRRHLLFLQARLKDNSSHMLLHKQLS